MIFPFLPIPAPPEMTGRSDRGSGASDLDEMSARPVSKLLDALAARHSVRVKYRGAFSRTRTVIAVMADIRTPLAGPSVRIRDRRASLAVRQTNLLQDRRQQRRMPARSLGRLRVKHETQRYDSHWNTDSNCSFEGRHNQPLYRLPTAFRKF